VARSSDAGKTFTQAVRISTNKWVINGCPLKPSIVTLDKKGRVYATWYAGEESPPGVHFAVSGDGGKTFSKAQRMHSEAKVSDHSQVAVSKDGRVYVVWDAKVGDVRRVYWRMSNDHGQTFGPVVELDAPAGEGTYPAIVVGADGNVYVAWQQSGQIVFRSLPLRGQEKSEARNPKQYQNQ
jgi:sugar lactone lactonase YvrE